MSTNARSQNGIATSNQPQTYFQQQRALLVSDIAQSMDNFLTQLNRLNRNLESVIAVGNEFSNVEALWSQFETVMGHPETSATETEGEVVADEVVDEGVSER